jgi:hypothetical protein
MAKVYYSSVLDWPSDDVWAVVRNRSPHVRKVAVGSDTRGA